MYNRTPPRARRWRVDNAIAASSLSPLCLQFLRTFNNTLVWSYNNRISFRVRVDACKTLPLRFTDERNDDIRRYNIDPFR